ncbi:MAG: bifunctional phosphopantothenoylcysteine decarboxylase/phosphopantothenate--cysteine ligase CoaBC [Agromyces sp.]
MSRIVVGVSGGIAAYKAVSLVRSLTQLGHDVHVVPTSAALRFVGLPTWEAISHNPVTSDLYDDVAQVRHVALGQSADLIVIAPATANTLAKLAHGLADDLLGTTVLASTAPVLVAPAMHTEMWLNAATQSNMQTLRQRGVHVIGPDSGALTGTDSGPGRMSEPDDIVGRVIELLGSQDADLSGMRVLVSAGGTREAIDPVRYLGNHSSGKQGLAIARAAQLRGAEVTLVLGLSNVEPPAGIRVERPTSALDMREVMLRLAPSQDIVVMAAAVADFRPVNVSDSKLRKADLGERLSLELVANPDILAELSAAKSPQQVIVGFAAETGSSEEEVVTIARAKLERKRCDVLVANRVGPGEDGRELVFGEDSTTVHILNRRDGSVRDASGEKLSVAHAILDEALRAH